jgi:hypothetical protein
MIVRQENIQNARFLAVSRNPASLLPMPREVRQLPHNPCRFSLSI